MRLTKCRVTIRRNNAISPHDLYVYSAQNPLFVCFQDRFRPIIVMLHDRTLHLAVWSSVNKLNIQWRSQEGDRGHRPLILQTKHKHTFKLHETVQFV